MQKLLIALTFCCGIPFSMNGQDFNDYFVDKTLRVDYIFTGDAEHQHIYLDELCALPEWAGRRHRLSELPLGGNGDIEMTDKATGK